MGQGWGMPLLTHQSSPCSAGWAAPAWDPVSRGLCHCHFLCTDPCAEINSNPTHAHKCWAAGFTHSLHHALSFVPQLCSYNTLCDFQAFRGNRCSWAASPRPQHRISWKQQVRSRYMSAAQTVGWSWSKILWKQWQDSPQTSKRPCLNRKGSKRSVIGDGKHLSLFPLWNWVPPSSHKPFHIPIFFPYLFPPCLENRLIWPG